MSQIDPFTLAQKMLNKAQCPQCEAQRLELRMSCEMGRGCSYRASCGDCNLEFDVSTGDEVPSSVKELLPNLICPECDKKGAEFAMVCSTESRSCEPVLACGECGHTYQSKQQNQKTA